MMKITRSELLRRVGRLSQVAGVSSGEYNDGPERHVRYLDMRSGAGLDMRVLIDRGFDIGEMYIGGVPVAWRSPTGFRAPWLTHPEEDAGAGLLRSFDGLLVTCGLDHVRGAASGPADHFGPRRSTLNYPMHGRISSSPAQLGGYGEAWHGEECVLWCEGVARQAMLYGESLSLSRRIEVQLGSLRVDIIDRVQNNGFRPVPHMLMYHLNFGYPLLDEGAELVYPRVSRDLPTRTASRVGMTHQPAPSDAPAADELLDFHLPAPAGQVAPRHSCGIVNDGLLGGLALEVAWDAATLPHLQIWRNLSAGIYALAVEPGTHSARKRVELEPAGAIAHLQPGQSVEYRVSMEAHVGPAAVAEFRERQRGA